jgi:hypothetical protein
VTTLRTARAIYVRAPQHSPQRDDDPVAWTTAARHARVLETSAMLNNATIAAEDEMDTLPGAEGSCEGGH